jgi:hypothetical protein
VEGFYGLGSAVRNLHSPVFANPSTSKTFASARAIAAGTVNNIAALG